MVNESLTRVSARDDAATRGQPDERWSGACSPVPLFNQVGLESKRGWYLTHDGKVTKLAVADPASDHSGV